MDELFTILNPALLLALGAAHASVAQLRSGRWPTPAVALAVIPGAAIVWNEWSFRQHRSAPDAVEVDLLVAGVVLLVALLTGRRRAWFWQVATYFALAAAAIQVGYSASRVFGPLGDSFNDQAAFAAVLLAAVTGGASMLLGAPAPWRYRLAIVAGTVLLVSPFGVPLALLGAAAVIAASVALVASARATPQGRGRAPQPL